MWKPLIKCSIVGGVIVFIWYMISWMVLPWHTATMSEFKDERAVANVILENAPKDGMYVIPDMHKSCDDKQEKKQDSDNYWDTSKMAEKRDMPFIFTNVVRKAPKEEMMTKSIIVGVITQIIGAFLVTLLLLRTKALTYGGRVCFVSIIGLLLGFLSAVPMWNWWGFPVGYTIVGILDPFIAWFFGGLAIAKLVK